MSDYNYHWYTGPRTSSIRINDMTEAATKEAIRLFQKKYVKPVRLVQGGMFGNGGGARASAGTHDGGGVHDSSVIGLSHTQVMHLVRCFRLVGFASWYRPYLAGVWSSHIHSVRIGDDSLSRGAANQVPYFKNRRDGLASERYDSINPWVGWTTWERYAVSHNTVDPVPIKPSGGIFDMTHVKEWERKGDIRLVQKRWTILPLDDNKIYTLFNGPTKDFEVNVHVEAAGVAANDAVQLRVQSYNVDKNGKATLVWGSKTNEIPQSSGSTLGDTTFNGNLGKPPKGFTRRLRLFAYVGTPGVTISNVHTYARWE